MARTTYAPIMFVSPLAFSERSVHLAYCERAPYRERTERIREFPCATYSDYSGSAVERSNYSELSDELSDAPGIVEFVGDYGTRGIAFRCNADGTPATGCRETNARIAEILESLESYPVLSEDAWSRTEMELADEQWADWGWREFRDELIKAAPAHEDALDELSVDAISDAFWTAQSDVGTYPEIEEGGGVIFWSGYSLPKLVKRALATLKIGE